MFVLAQPGIVYLGLIDGTSANIRAHTVDIEAILGSVQVPATTPSDPAQPKVHYGTGDRVESETGSFSMVVPKHWRWYESDGAIYLAGITGLPFIGFGSDTALGTDVTLSSFAKVFFANDKHPETVKFQGGGHLHIGAILTDTVDYTYGTDAQPRAARLALLKRGSKTFFAFVMSTPAQQKTSAADLDSIFASIQLSNQIFGVERSQAFVDLGSVPDKYALDPAIFVGSAAGYPGYLFSGLVRLTPKLQVEPDLAESWVPSPDGKTYTFTLRTHLTFADGHPMTASDVKYSWERAADPAIGGNTAATYLGDIVGIQAIVQGKAKHADGIRAIDARSLAVVLDAPKPYALAKLAYPTGYVVDQRTVEADPEHWFMHVNASGPYKIKQIVENRAIVFERNERYWQPAKLPFVVFLLNAGGSPLSLYQSGAIDIFYPSDEQAKQIADPSDPLHAQVQTVDSLCSTLLVFDTAQAPTDDINVRKALAQAIDWAAIFKRTQIDTDRMQTGILPPPLPGHLDREAQLPFDVQAAKAALAKSKYAGKSLTLVLSSYGQSGTPNPSTAAIIDMWQKTLGVTVTIDYLGRDFAKSARAKHGNVMRRGWCADYPDPQNFLDVLFHSSSADNILGYHNPAVDRLLEQARTEQTADKRLKLYQQAEDMILADVGAVAFSGGPLHVVVKPYARGFEASAIGVKLSHLLSFEGFPGAQ